MDRPNSTRRGTLITALTWGSDSDLVSDLGIRLGPEFSNPRPSLPRLAPVALPHASYHPAASPIAVDSKDWTFPDRSSGDSDDTSDLKKYPRLDPDPSPADVTLLTRRTSFFDIGGLLEEADSPPRSHHSRRPSAVPAIPVQQDAPEHHRGRQGSLALLRDLGGLLAPEQTPSGARRPSATATATRNFSRPGSGEREVEGAEVGVARERERERERPMERPRPVRTNTFQDVGGLLG